MATHTGEDRFGGIVENLFKVAALGLAVVWVVTFFLRQMGVIEVDTKFVGIGYSLLAVSLGLMAAYLYVVKKEFAFNWKTDLFPLALIIAVVVGVVYFLPQVLPEIYSASALNLKLMVQSIVGGLG